jgi:hypothetical protein
MKMNDSEQLLECRPTGNPTKERSGIGMPATLYLHQFGDLLFHAFGEVAYHVGSSLIGAVWRDVDVRVMLDKEQYAAMGFGDPEHPHENEKWCAFTMAFSELGRKMTGLPIDFQIQETDKANADYHRPDQGRSALMLCALRRGNADRANTASKVQKLEQIIDDGLNTRPSELGDWKREVRRNMGKP